MTKMVVTGILYLEVIVKGLTIINLAFILLYSFLNITNVRGSSISSSGMLIKECQLVTSLYKVAYS